MAAALSIPAAVYCFLRPKLRKEQDWAEAGDIAKMAPNSPVEMVFPAQSRDGGASSAREHRLGGEAR